MTTDGAAANRADVVAAAEVDSVLWGMNSDLVHLRRQLAELRRTLEEREQKLGESTQRGEGSDRAVSTLKVVLTEMVMKARTELQAARDEAKRSMSERLASAQAEADLLVADAAAALTAALGRPGERPPSASVRRDPGASGPPSASSWPIDGMPPMARPWPADAPHPPERFAALSWPAEPPPPPPTPPPTAQPWSSAASAASTGAAFSPPAPRNIDETAARGSADPGHGVAMNGSRGRPASVQTLDYDLKDRFEQVIGLRPNADFRTPPRGIPAVPASLAPDLTGVTAAVAPVAAPVADAGQEAFNEFWPSSAAATEEPSGSTSEGSGGKLHFSIIDALLPIIALTLVLIVVLSWTA